MPMTTASMMKAASTGLGRSEKSGARSSSVSRTVTPEVSEARPVLAPEWSFSELADRLVETGMPWNRPAPVLAIPGRRTPGRCRSGSGAWRRRRGRRPRSGRSRSAPARQRRPPPWPRGPTSAPGRGRSNDGSPRGHVADERHAAVTQVQQPGGEQAADHQDQRAGHLRGDRRSPKTTTSATTPTTTVGRVPRPECPATTTAPGAGWPRHLGAGELGQLADDDVDRRPEEEAGDHGAREELRDPPHLQHRDEQEQDSRRERDARRRTTRRPARR